MLIVVITDSAYPVFTTSPSGPFALGVGVGTLGADFGAERFSERPMTRKSLGCFVLEAGPAIKMDQRADDECKGAFSTITGSFIIFGLLCFAVAEYSILALTPQLVFPSGFWSCHSLAVRSECRCLWCHQPH